MKKYTVVKKVENQKIKEVPVPYKVYHIEKVPYKYYVHPLIVKVPIEYFHTKHEEIEKHHGGGGGGGGGGGHGGGGHGGGHGGGGKDEYHHDDVEQQQQHYEHDEQPTIIGGHIQN